MKKEKTRFARRRSRKQKRQRTRRLRHRGGGDTFNRNIPNNAVIANPTFESDMGLKSQSVSIP